MRKCPYRVAYGDIINGGFLLPPKIFLLKLKNRLLGVKETIMEMKKRYPGSTSIIRRAHRTLACTEVFLPYEILIKRDGIDSIGFTDFDSFLQSEGSRYVPFPIHPRIDPVTKELYLSQELMFLLFYHSCFLGKLTHFRVPGKFSIFIERFFHVFRGYKKET